MGICMCMWMLKTWTRRITAQHQHLPYWGGGSSRIFRFPYGSGNSINWSITGTNDCGSANIRNIQTFARMWKSMWLTGVLMVLDYILLDIGSISGDETRNEFYVLIGKNDRLNWSIGIDQDSHSSIFWQRRTRWCTIFHEQCSFGKKHTRGWYCVFVRITDSAGNSG